MSPFCFGFILHSVFMNTDMNTYVKHLAWHLHVILLSDRIQVFLYSYFVMYFSETFSKFSETLFARSWACCLWLLPNVKIDSDF